MTPHQQRIFIAEKCGYYWTRTGMGGNNYYLVHKSATNQRWDPTEEDIEKSSNIFPFTPDYPTDLNAMHEAEKVLTPEQWERYLEELGDFPESDYMVIYDEPALAPSQVTFKGMVHKDAQQRADAFCKVFGEE